MKILKSQQKIIISIALVVIAFLGFLLFVYLPKHRAMHRLRMEMNTIKDKISRIQTVFGELEQLTNAIISQKKQLATLEVKFPKRQDIHYVIKELSNHAARFKINIISITPHEPTPYVDSSGAPVLIDGRPVEKLPLAIELECSFLDFGKYLESLFTNMPAQISVDGLKISRDEKTQPNLKITLIVTAYVLSDKG